MMGLSQPKLEALMARVAGLAQPSNLSAARKAALDRLMSMGLPGRRDEYWRYSDPTSLNADHPEPAAPFKPTDLAPVFGKIDRLRITFVDGVFAPDRSDDLAMAGVEITRLAEVPDGHWAEAAYGLLEARGQSPVARPFAALNSAYAQDGLLIRVRGRAPRPISVIYVHESEVSDPILHHVIQLEPGAELTFLENGAGAARLNKVIEVEVGAGARFNHVRTQGRAPQRRAMTHLFARLQERSVLKSFTLTANGRLSRNEVVIELAGNDGVAHVAGAAVADGAYHHDDTVFITHAAERCESRQVYKKVLMNGAVGVFQGKILVKPGAQKTDGYQISQSLLMDDDSQFLAKPELEIYADDVKCSHGSTTGAIDETAMFYLRSRGVPQKTAQALLMLAFLAETIDEIEDEAIADDIRERMEIWLHRHEH